MIALQFRASWLINDVQERIPSASLRYVFWQFRYRSWIFRSASIICDVICRYLASSRPLPSGQRSKPRWKTHRRRTSVLWYLLGERTRNENGERYCPATNAANSQVRQLDSTCNLIFTVVGTAQTWTLLSYSLRRDDAFIPNHRFHQKPPLARLSESWKASVLSTRRARIYIRRRSFSFSLSFFFSLLRLNFDGNAKNTRRSKRSIRGPI